MQSIKRKSVHVDKVQLLLDYVRVNNIKFPSTDKFIVSHESVLDHKTDISKDGLFICTQTHLCLSKSFALIHQKENWPKCSLYLNVRRTNDSSEFTRMSMNINGGFHMNHPGVVFWEKYSFVLVSSETEFVEIELSELTPELVDSFRLKDYVMIVQTSFLKQYPSWDGEQKVEISSVASNLNANFTVDSNMWTTAKCQSVDCNIIDLGQLWLNMHTGYIGCGFKASNHSLTNYRTEEKFPLVLRLGSITSSGTAEIYSYEEDRFVLVPNLTDYLLKIKLDFTGRTNPVKTIRMEEFAMNYEKSSFERIEWVDDYQLKRVFGKELTGLRNPNSYCYIHSAIQTLIATCQSYKKQFYQASKQQQYRSANLETPTTHHLTQSTKLVTSICDGQYTGPSYPLGMHTDMYKTAIDSYGHEDFSTLEPQCPLEYTQYLMQLLPQNNGENFSNSFDFIIELTDLYDNGKVECQKQFLNVLSLSVSNVLKKLQNDRSRDVVHEGSEYFSIHINDFLKYYFEDKKVDNEGDETDETVTRRTKITTFPQLLMIQVGQKEVPESTRNYNKLAIPSFDVDEEIDLREFKSDKSNQIVHPPKKPEELSQVTQLALVEMRTVEPQISEADAIVALQRWKNDVKKAVEWYNQNKEEFEKARVVRQNADKLRSGQLGAEVGKFEKSSSTKYRLRAVIEHQGTTTSSGHFVAHIRRPVQATKPWPQSSKSLSDHLLPPSATPGTSDTPMDTSPPSPSSSSSSSKQYEWYVYNDEVISQVVSQLPNGRQCPPAFGYVFVYEQIVD